MSLTYTGKFTKNPLSREYRCSHCGSLTWHKAYVYGNHIPTQCGCLAKAMRKELPGVQKTADPDRV